jgi:hypothetical protein
MEARVIKEYDPKNHNITTEFLYDSDDWDLIELNYNIDSAKLLEWWNTMLADHAQNIFNFNEQSDKIDIEKSKEMVTNGYCGYYCGPIDGITLAWPTPRYEPLPPPMQCNPELYPEVNRDTFINDAVILSKYKVGYFSELIDILGADSFRQAIVSRHHPGMYIKQHIDSKRLKLHIPIETNDGAFFHFGKDRDRSYHMKQGKAYILNTGDWHGTSNSPDHFRSHLISRVTREHIQTLIGL